MTRPELPTSDSSRPDPGRPQMAKVRWNGPGAVRAFAVLAVVGALAFATWWFTRGVEVKATTPVQGNAAEVVYATGAVEPVLWAKIVAPQRKRIVELCRCEGKAVQKGEVLGRLDDVEERAVLTELEARLKRLREDVDRLKALLDRNAGTRTAYEDKVTQMREQEARYAAQLDRIRDLELRSPMDGVVLRRDGEVGEIAGTGNNDVLLWVGQPLPLRVVAEVNEEDIGKVREGQTVLLRHEGLATAALTAKVGSITPKGDPQTKTFRVYLALPDDSPLKIGMSIEANIVVREVAGATLLPAEAIGDKQIQIVQDGRVRLFPVETGIRGTRMVEVRTPLPPGATVISPYRNDLREQRRVRPAIATKKP